MIRKFKIRQWLKELGRVTNTPIELSVVKDEVTPYMREDGLICFCKKDILRADRLFMLLAHEAAHFILMQDKNYGAIKELDSVYKSQPQREQKMHSPIEFCANVITLMILERCKNAERWRKTQEKIEICIKSLKKQLTN